MLFSILFAVAILVQTYVFFSFFSRKPDARNSGENLFFSLTAAVCTAVFLATLLVIIGVYSFGLLCGLYWAEGLVVAAFSFRKLLVPKKAFSLILRHPYSKALAAILIVAAVLYFAFPTEYLLGGRDPGLYFIDGVHISQTGRMQYATDSFIDKNYENIKDVVRVSYPGLYSAFDRGLSSHPGKLIPQFLPMLPSSLAVGYDIGGIGGLIRVNGFIGLICLLAIYYFTKRYFGKKAGLLATLFMAVNPAELWNARITQTELLAQLFFFLSVYVFARGWEKRSWRHAALAGFFAGVGLFNRIDMLILGLGVYALVWYSSLFRPDTLRLSLTLAGAYTFTGAVALWYGFTFSNPYCTDLLGMGLGGILILNGLFLGVAVVLCFLRLLFLKKREVKNVFLGLMDSQGGMIVVSLVFFVLFMFAYYYRAGLSGYPVGTDQYFSAHAMVEFCYYTSLFAFPFAILGLYTVLHKKGKGREALFLFILIALANVIGYIYKPSISKDHIWASRRWIPVCIPAVMILCSAGILKAGTLISKCHRWFLSRLGNSQTRRLFLIFTLAYFPFIGLVYLSSYVKPDIFGYTPWDSWLTAFLVLAAATFFYFAAAVLLCGIFAESRVRLFGRYALSKIGSMKTGFVALCTLFFVLYGVMRCSPFLLTPMLAHLDSQYSTLSAELSSDKIYYTRDGNIASVLRYVYGKRVYYMSQTTDSPQFTALVKTYGTVNYIGKMTAVGDGVAFQKLSSHAISGKFLNRTVAVFPSGLFTLKEVANIYLVQMKR